MIKCGPSITPCCGSFGVTIAVPGASGRVVFGGGLIQTAVGRVLGRGGPTGSTLIVRGVTPIKGGTDYSLHRLTMRDTCSVLDSQDWRWMPRDYCKYCVYWWRWWD